MKILWDNYLKDSTITADYEDTQYPLSNLYHKFLEKVYKPGNLSATITIEMPENRTISAIALGFTNLESVDSPIIMLDQSATDTIQLDQTATDTINLRIAEGLDFELQNFSGATLYTGDAEMDYDTNTTYFDPITCRRIILKLTSLSPDIYVGGISAGDPLEFEYHQVNPRFSTEPSGTLSKTTGGQVLGKNYAQLRSWDAVIDSMGNDKRKEVLEMVNSIGAIGTVYADIYDLNHDEEEPMYATFTNVATLRRESTDQTYTMGIAVQEAR